jgi:hypothetical protein
MNRLRFDLDSRDRLRIDRRPDGGDLREWLSAQAGGSTPCRSAAMRAK